MHMPCSSRPLDCRPQPGKAGAAGKQRKADGAAVAKRVRSTADGRNSLPAAKRQAVPEASGACLLPFVQGLTDQMMFSQMDGLSVLSSFMHSVCSPLIALDCSALQACCLASSMMQLHASEQCACGSPAYLPACQHAQAQHKICTQCFTRMCCRCQAAGTPAGCARRPAERCTARQREQGRTTRRRCPPQPTAAAQRGA